ncbi:hypothetical protein F4803DRAFT_532033 [Xylaria telfairii]|nr:hypothetical protein F4803DRAFT_532033 [Xylaria telfairii]
MTGLRVPQGTNYNLVEQIVFVFLIPIVLCQVHGYVVYECYTTYPVYSTCPPTQQYYVPVHTTKKGDAGCDGRTVGAAFILV